MNVRLATQDDAERLTSLINRAFVVERFFIDADRLDLAEVLHRLQTGQFLLLEDDGALVACAYLELRGERSYLGLLSVHPDRQGRGIGSRMMEAAEDYCRQAGCRYLDLRVVNLRLELPPFYHKRGFTTVGTSPFPAGQPVTRECHFIEMSKLL